MYAGAAPRDVTGREFSKRAFGTLRPSLLLSSACPARGPFGALRQRHQFSDLLANVRILTCARLLRALEDKVNAAGALRIPCVRLIRLLGFSALFKIDPPLGRPAPWQRTHRVNTAALVGERRHRHLPPIADPPDQILLRDFRVSEEHLVKRRVPIHLLER